MLLQALNTFQKLPAHLRALLGDNPQSYCPFTLRVTKDGCQGSSLMFVTEFRDGDAWGYLLYDTKASEPTLSGLIKAAEHVGRVRKELTTDEQREVLDHYEEGHSLGTVGFGKYRGMKVEDLMRTDPRYVVWANENISSFNDQIVNRLSTLTGYAG